VVSLDSDFSLMLKSASSALTTPKIRSTQYIKQARQRGNGRVRREGMVTAHGDERYNK